jgi:hypothetical protein
MEGLFNISGLIDGNGVHNLGNDENDWRIKTSRDQAFGQLTGTGDTVPMNDICG